MFTTPRHLPLSVRTTWPELVSVVIPESRYGQRLMWSNKTIVTASYTLLSPSIMLVSRETRVIEDVARAYYDWLLWLLTRLLVSLCILLASLIERFMIAAPSAAAICGRCRNKIAHDAVSTPDGRAPTHSTRRVSTIDCAALFYTGNQLHFAVEAAWQETRAGMDNISLSASWRSHTRRRIKKTLLRISHRVVDCFDLSTVAIILDSPASGMRCLNLPAPTEPSHHGPSSQTYTRVDTGQYRTREHVNCYCLFYLLYPLHFYDFS